MISVLPATMQNGTSEVVMPVVTQNNLHVCVHFRNTLLQVLFIHRNLKPAVDLKKCILQFKDMDKEAVGSEQNC